MNEDEIQDEQEQVDANVEADAGVQAMEDQVAQLTAALQRERADALNLRRRHEEQISSMSSSAKASVVRALLPVIDNFERALKHVPAELEGNDYIKGVQGVVKQFEKTLADLGVQKIKTVGEPFDPHLHEAVSMEDGDGDQEIVSEELQSGYALGDDVIRHAMVRVSTK
jgi:molecular chaperone GrpE